jgi:hypothetical protein
MIIEIDDAEDEWLYKPDSVDFVHARFLFFAIRNWPRFLNQAMKYDVRHCLSFANDK